MERLDLYKCEICNNIVETIVVGGGELVCCGQPMKKLEAKNKEEAMMEKHIPIFTKQENGKNEVRVGEVLHPMTDEHYIMFIETISEDKNHADIKFLHPNDQPIKEIDKMLGKMTAREYCNIHGLWEGESD